MPAKWVRIKAENGHEVTINAARADALGLTPLDKPAVDRFGQPLPDKPRNQRGSTASGAPAEAPATRKGASKENS